MTAETKPMSVYEATMIAEGVEEADRETFVDAVQLLIDTGTCWQLQGYFGRLAAQMIEEGYCEPARRAA